MLPRRFALVRHVDYTGVSGVGVVAYGVVFADGHVALRWASTHPATSLWSSIDDLVAVHGHGEATSIEWLDPATDPFAQPAASRGAGRRARRVTPDPEVPEPIVEPDVTRPTRPITLEPEPEPEPVPAEPEAAARPEPAASPEPAARPEPGRPDPVTPEMLGRLPHPEPLKPRSQAEPAAPAPAPATTETPPPPPPVEARAADHAARSAHPRLPAQRGAGRHRRSGAESPSRTTYQVESDGT
ncbi:hypothetical protein [Jiangella mangrovi]|uniref:Outer membrane biosynthesis protein TonB n=1 Tax=Jiangella mangrovi TaxID=1524084 RepID=A0A7W9LJZ9_9ACTN|nr:hypothetical protein [Jiangella mangrovi]MBB5786583.1 outer membrane biosynthesis protein TonB [Jiangella mangrovi]